MDGGSECGVSWGSEMDGRTQLTGGFESNRRGWKSGQSIVRLACCRAGCCSHMRLFGAKLGSGDVRFVDCTAILYNYLPVASHHHHLCGWCVLPNGGQGLQVPIRTCKYHPQRCGAVDEHVPFSGPLALSQHPAGAICLGGNGLRMPELWTFGCELLRQLVQLNQVHSIHLHHCNNSDAQLKSFDAVAICCLSCFFSPFFAN